MAANKFGKTPLDRAGPALATTLREQADALGQSLEIQHMPAVDTSEVVGRARAMFVAAHGKARGPLPGRGGGSTGPSCPPHAAAARVRARDNDFSQHRV